MEIDSARWGCYTVLLEALMHKLTQPSSMLVLCDSGFLVRGVSRIWRCRQLSPMCEVDRTIVTTGVRRSLLAAERRPKLGPVEGNALVKHTAERTSTIS